MENNINKNQLPPELDWSNMQSGIRDKMEAIEAQERLGRRRRNGMIITIVTVVVLVLLLLGPCKSLWQNDNGRLSDVTTSELPVSIPSSTESEDVSDDLSASADNDVPLSQSNSMSIGRSINSSGEGTSTSINTGRSISEDAIAGVSRSVGTDAQSSRVSRSLGTVRNDKTNTAAELQAAEMQMSAHTAEGPVLKEGPDENSKRDVRSFVLVPSGSMNAIETEKSKPVINQIIPTNHSSLAENRVSLMGGAAFWNMGYGSNEPERAEFEETLVSFAGGVNYAHVFRSGFFGMIGLNMIQLESRFEWSQELENYTITLTDTIAEVQLNAITGEYTNIVGDVDVSVGAERQVIHYNTTRLIQVPLAVGKSWRWNRWQADLMLGAVMNVHAANTGRTLFEGELTEYDGASTDFMSNQWTVHGLGAVDATYRITEQIGVTAGVQFQKSISNWSTEEGIGMRPYLFGGQIGLTYTFE